MNKIKTYLVGETITTNESEAFSLHKKSNFGEITPSKKIRYTLSEALYLVEKNKIEIIQKNKVLAFEDLLKKLKKIDSRIQLKYPVFKNLREKGHVVKTALKFGADFRVYGKGSRPGKTHAKWIVFIDHESNKLTWHEFSAKNRVAHSTKKNLLIAIVDEEGDISYYEVGWIKI